MVKGGCMAKGGGACMGYDEIRKYDQCAGGTHPTGMHSCITSVFKVRYEFSCAAW